MSRSGSARISSGAATAAAAPPAPPGLASSARPAEREPEHVRAGVTHEECGGTARPVVEGQEAEASARQSGGDDRRARPGTRPPTKARPIAAIAAVPAARPSMLSRRLKLFMLATRIRHASGMPAQAGSQSGVETGAGGEERDPDLSGELRICADRAPSSHSPSAKAAPAQDEREVALDPRPRRRTTGTSTADERAEERDAARDGRHRTVPPIGKRDRCRKRHSTYRRREIPRRESPEAGSRRRHEDASPWSVADSLPENQRRKSDPPLLAFATSP